MGALRQRRPKPGTAWGLPWQKHLTNPARPPGFPDHPEGTPRPRPRGGQEMGPGTSLGPSPQLCTVSQSPEPCLPGPVCPPSSPGGAQAGGSPPLTGTPGLGGGQFPPGDSDRNTSLSSPRSWLSPYTGRPCGQGGLKRLLLPFWRTFTRPKNREPQWAAAFRQGVHTHTVSTPSPREKETAQGGHTARLREDGSNLGPPTPTTCKLTG